MPSYEVRLPEEWQTAEFDPHFCDVVAEATLPKGRKALVLWAMLLDGTCILALTWKGGARLARITAPAPPDIVSVVRADDYEALLELLKRAQSLFPIEKPEQGGDPDWVASIKRDVAEALDD